MDVHVNVSVQEGRLTTTKYTYYLLIAAIANNIWYNFICNGFYNHLRFALFSFNNIFTVKRIFRLMLYQCQILLPCFRQLVSQFDLFHNAPHNYPHCFRPVCFTS